jgi:hypothetical protein
VADVHRRDLAPPEGLAPARLVQVHQAGLRIHLLAVDEHTRIVGLVARRRLEGPVVFQRDVDARLVQRLVPAHREARAQARVLGALVVPERGGHQPLRHQRTVQPDLGLLLQQLVRRGGPRLAVDGGAGRSREAGVEQGLHGGRRTRLRARLVLAFDQRQRLRLGGGGQQRADHRVPHRAVRMGGLDVDLQRQPAAVGQAADQRVAAFQVARREHLAEGERQRRVLAAGPPLRPPRR